MTTIGVFANIFDETRRILCVKRAYGPKNWTTPGGGMEAGETPLQALVREVQEETGYLVRPGRLIGVYSKPERDDLVLSIDAEIIGKNPWRPNSEIAEFGFFGPDELPRPMQRSTHMRLMDAFDRKFGVIREIAGKT